jgi:hypothetical protein
MTSPWWGKITRSWGRIHPKLAKICHHPYDNINPHRKKKKTSNNGFPSRLRLFASPLMSTPSVSSRLLLLIRRRGRRLPGFPALESHSIAVPLQTLVARLLIVVEVRALG